MLTKSASLVLRSFFVAAVVGSLVACTLEPSSEDQQKGDTTSAISASKKHKTDSDAAVGPVTETDAGFEDNDASCTKCDEDGGAYDADGGVSDADGGTWGDDDDDTSDGGIYNDRDAGF